MSNRIDLTGKKFGRLIVIGSNGTDKYYKLFWKCKCDCGKNVSVRGDRLKSGNTKSCGCLNAELVKKRAAEKSIMGRVKEERLYRIWQSMKQRCYDKNSCEFERYGKRGITICEEWTSNYYAFKEWAIQNGYSNSLSIDRINVNGDYTPENCKWSTPKEQANNRRNSWFLVYKGKKQTLAEWSDELKIPYACLYRRLKSNWPIEKAFTKPSRKLTTN
ncbi:hypothetical protein PSR14_31170 (plasmid) [Bacillus sp. A01H]|uniref:hypothetical protein n=1 Tax=Bacillus sp. A01H TaxID=3026426 RepID=UPI0037039968